MKKIFVRLGLSLLIAAVISGGIFAFHGYCARTLGHMPLSQTLLGGECIQEMGFGWLITTFYPMSSADNPQPSTTHVEFYRPSLVRGAIAVLIAAVALVFIIGAIKDIITKKKAAKTAE